MLIIETTEFKTAAGYAKSVAILNKKNELTPLIFLFGIMLAFKKNELVLKINEAENIFEEVVKLTIEENLNIADIKEPTLDKSFPIASNLKNAIGDNKNGNLNDLALTLAKYLNIIQKTKAEIDIPISLFTIAEDPIFIIVDRYAKGLSKKYGYDISTPEIYAMGALVALNKGDLIDKPSLSAHLSAYSREFTSWIEEQGWQDLENLCSYLNNEIPDTISDSHPLHNFRKERNPLIALLNAGIEKVSQTRAIECVAYHEAGHAIVSLVLRPKVSLDNVTIVPGEYYDGLTSFDTTNPIYKHVFPSTREDFLEDLCVSLAGQAAQLKKYGFNAADIGAKSDYAAATEFAWQYITEFGLDDSFGPVQLTTLSKQFNIKSGWLFDEAQKRLQAILKEAQQKTEIILSEHWDNVENIVKGLIEKKTLDEDQIRSLMIANETTTIYRTRR